MVSDRKENVDSLCGQREFQKSKNLDNFKLSGDNESIEFCYPNHSQYVCNSR